MTEQLRTTSGVVIKWDRPDRMRKALRLAGMTVQEMADYDDLLKEGAALRKQLAREAS